MSLTWRRVVSAIPKKRSGDVRRSPLRYWIIRIWSTRVLKRSLIIIGYSSCSRCVRRSPLTHFYSQDSLFERHSSFLVVLVTLGVSGDRLWLITISRTPCLKGPLRCHRLFLLFSVGQAIAIDPSPLADLIATFACCSRLFLVVLRRSPWNGIRSLTMKTMRKGLTRSGGGHALVLAEWRHCNFLWPLTSVNIS